MTWELPLWQPLGLRNRNQKRSEEPEMDKHIRQAGGAAFPRMMLAQWGIHQPKKSNLELTLPGQQTLVGLS